MVIYTHANYYFAFSVLGIYCCATNHPKCSALKHPFVIACDPVVWVDGSSALCGVLYAEVLGRLGFAGLHHPRWFPSSTGSSARPWPWTPSLWPLHDLGHSQRCSWLLKGSSPGTRDSRNPGENSEAFYNLASEQPTLDQGRSQTQARCKERENRPTLTYYTISSLTLTNVHS